MRFNYRRAALSFACADSVMPSIEIEGVSRDKMKNELVLRLTRNSEFRLVQETSFRVSFDRDVESPTAKPLYQSSPPVNRFDFTIADTDHGAQVATNVVLIENSGTPLERRTALKAGKEAQEAQKIVELIKGDVTKANDVSSKTIQPVVVAKPKVYFRPVHSSRSRAPMAAQYVATHIDASRLGFSAQLPKDDSRGLVIIAVDPKTPAAKAGLHTSDILTAIDGQPITTGEQMDAARLHLMTKKQGEIKVIRDGKVYTAMVKFR